MSTSDFSITLRSYDEEIRDFLDTVLLGSFGGIQYRVHRETSTLYSGGIGIPLSRDFFLDITTQYIQWKDRSVLYEYQDMAIY